jgi:hypothetical protein
MVRGGNEQRENRGAIRITTEKKRNNKCARLRRREEY